jgi:hypothetical protein
VLVFVFQRFGTHDVGTDDLVCGNPTAGTQTIEGKKERTVDGTMVRYVTNLFEHDGEQGKGTDQEIMNTHDQNKNGYRLINLEDQPDVMRTISRAEQELNRLLQQDVALVAYVRQDDSSL